jgi:hypothetical protein
MFIHTVQYKTTLLGTDVSLESIHTYIRMPAVPSNSEIRFFMTAYTLYSICHINYKSCFARECMNIEHQRNQEHETLNRGSLFERLCTKE